VKNTLKNMESIDGKSMLPTAPIPAMSAPMFITIAGKLNKSITYKSGRE
jgi:hypothetical protein